MERAKERYKEREWERGSWKISCISQRKKEMKINICISEGWSGQKDFTSKYRKKSFTFLGRSCFAFIYLCMNLYLEY